MNVVAHAAGSKLRFSGLHSKALYLPDRLPGTLGLTFE